MYSCVRVCAWVWVDVSEGRVRSWQITLNFPLFLFSIPHPGLKIRSAVTCCVCKPKKQQETEKRKEKKSRDILNLLNRYLFGSL